MVADYNQIELRCIAHLANDPGLIEAFTSGQDVHSATAARVFGIAESDVSYEQRSKAKMVSYGLAYGMEAFGLGQRLGIRTDEAAEILNAYFAAFPNVQAYMDRTVAEAKTRGYTETLFGRRRRIPELENSNFRIRQAGERQAMNAAIQGLAADIFKIALIRIDAALSEAKLVSRLVLQVHDEVIVEVPHAEPDGDQVDAAVRVVADHSGQLVRVGDADVRDAVRGEDDPVDPVPPECGIGERVALSQACFEVRRATWSEPVDRIEDGFGVQIALGAFAIDYRIAVNSRDRTSRGLQYCLARRRIPLVGRPETRIKIALACRDEAELFR